MEIAFQAARTLIPTIDQLLDEGGTTRQELAAIAVTTGPGSFTGVRIGVTTAKTVAYALGLPAVGINTLDAIARATNSGASEGAAGGTGGKRLWVAMDAQRGDLFVAEYPLPWLHHQQWEDPTSLLSRSSWLAGLQPGDVVTGPAELKAELSPEVEWLELPSPQEVAAGVGRLAWKFLEWGRGISPLELVPHYYRASAAEEKRRLG